MGTGTVMFFNELKGYGLIRSDESGPDIKVYRSGLKLEVDAQGRTISPFELSKTVLRSDQRVSFDIQKGPMNNCAINVTAISSTTEPNPGNE